MSEDLAARIVQHDHVAALFEREWKRVAVVEQTTAVALRPGGGSVAVLERVECLAGVGNSWWINVACARSDLRSALSSASSARSTSAVASLSIAAASLTSDLTATSLPTRFASAARSSPSSAAAGPNFLRRRMQLDVLVRAGVCATATSSGKRNRGRAVRRDRPRSPAACSQRRSRATHERPRDRYLAGAAFGRTQYASRLWA